MVPALAGSCPECGYEFSGVDANLSSKQLADQLIAIEKECEVEKQKELEDKVWEASAGGGAVTVKVSGKKEILSVTLSPEVVDPDDIEMLQDLIVAATNEALRKMEDEQADMFNSLSGGMSGLGGLGGLF